ncbi:hypothetical protein SS50377_20171 [Spironucleus salmonicida]|uniref:Uncharacterized protein n=1 Tax=Spironucleus salmonicida TaxID=348837 RepID=V6LND4_9EUKA|nr:hypothetical protein SS50377_20171 [Spironucleus salmonicida]|eukprot:EST45226.1 Hypothetical protein SS50377_14801 [Spironucleus salmonicida]
MEANLNFIKKSLSSTSNGLVKPSKLHKSFTSEQMDAQLNNASLDGLYDLIDSYKKTDISKTSCKFQTLLFD